MRHSCSRTPGKISAKRGVPPFRQALRWSFAAAVAGATAFAHDPVLAQPKAEPLTIGVVPQQSASRLARLWIPFLDEVSKHLQVPVRFTTARDIPTFEHCLEVGAYDLAYLNPLHYVVFHKVAGYQAIARKTGPGLKGIMVTRAEGGITDLSQLSGKTIAFPSPAAFGASIVPRGELSARGIPFTPQYVKSHDSVYGAVASGLMPAGGGIHQTFNTIPASLRGQLKIFYETKFYSPHAFAAHPRVPTHTASRIQKALVAASVEAPDLAKELGFAGIETAKDADWNDVRSLKTDPAAVNIGAPRNIQCL